LDIIIIIQLNLTCYRHDMAKNAYLALNDHYLQILTHIDTSKLIAQIIAVFKMFEKTKSY
jgi:hypothetical protein